MHITVNGSPCQLPDEATVADLLAHLDLTGRRVAVERNQEIVVRSHHSKTLLQEGDRLEIVQAIGGG